MDVRHVELSSKWKAKVICFASYTTVVKRGMMKLRDFSGEMDGQKTSFGVFQDQH